MSVRYILAPQAALDVFEIWQYVKEQTSVTIADRVESAIRERMAFLAENPGAGHHRKDLTEADVKFFPVYSYLIVYRPETKQFNRVGRMPRIMIVGESRSLVGQDAASLGSGGWTPVESTGLPKPEMTTLIRLSPKAAWTLLP
ncbi:MAG: type II toxin-antitoxin system RelE/ParE family toxin [Candidatus Acidoferrales bacterium]|nr:type II toxin-antitoxin system RelE/ParE family toxin [Candidatus Acidoferrales bacterium]